MAFRVPQGYSEFPECRRQGTEERQCEDAPHTNVTTLACNAQDQLTKLTAPDGSGQVWQGLPLRHPTSCSLPGRCTAASARSGLDRQLRATWGPRLRVTRQT